MTQIKTRAFKATDLFFNLREGDLMDLHSNHPSVEHTKALVIRAASVNDLSPVLVVLTMDEGDCLILNLDDADPDRHTSIHTISLAGRVTQAVLNFP